MKLLHHGAEVRSEHQIAQDVIVIVEEGCDEPGESKLLCLVEDAIPEDRFGFFRFKRSVPVPTSRGDEIDRVVAIPMLEAVLRSEVFFGFARTVAEMGHCASVSRKSRGSESLLAYATGVVA